MTSTADITTNSNAAILELNSSNAAEGMLTMTTARTLRYHYRGMLCVVRVLS
jgi:hypothetical protein